MTGTNSRPTIVAVFGGTRGIRGEVLKLATCAGSKIAAAKFVVLTGDKLKGQEKNPEAVKDAAQLGAAPDGHWIGVLKEAGNPIFQKEGDKGGVIWSGMGDRRNFLEASLSDAAIVLEGAEGTISEAVSAISLGKPVLLVGTAWATRYPALHRVFQDRVLTGNPKDILVKESRKRLGGETDESPIRGRIEQALKPGSIQLDERSQLVSADGMQACSAIASWLTEIRVLPQKGEFPPVGEPYSQARNDYHQWLEGLLPPKP
jgi:predicted Rossmann-fold nucleotide-binding protein